VLVFQAAILLGIEWPLCSTKGDCLRSILMVFMISHLSAKQIFITNTPGHIIVDDWFTVVADFVVIIFELTTLRIFSKWTTVNGHPRSIIIGMSQFWFCARRMLYRIGRRAQN